MTSQTTSADYAAATYRLSTAAFAAQNLVQAQTVRKLYAASGSYHGVRPLRLPNRRLLWPSNSIDYLLPHGVESAK